MTKIKWPRLNLLLHLICPRQKNLFPFWWHDNQYLVIELGVDVSYIMGSSQ